MPLFNSIALIVKIKVVVGLIGTNWNQIKRELITMWQIVKTVRGEAINYVGIAKINQVLKG